LRRYSQIYSKKMKKTKITKDNKRKFHKKHYIYNVKNNNLLKKNLLNNNDFNIKKNINKEFATLFKENGNKNFNNE